MNEDIKITFCTTDCSRCRVLKRKLDEKELNYKTLETEKALQKILDAGFDSAPMLIVDGVNKTFSDAIKWVALCK